MSEHEGLLQHEPDTGSSTDVPLILATGAAGALLVLVIVVVLQALYYRSEDAEFRAKILSEPALQLRQLQVKQKEALTGYRILDPKQGVVAIPIERAMELVAAEASRPAPALEARP